MKALPRLLDLLHRDDSSSTRAPSSFEKVVEDQSGDKDQTGYQHLEEGTEAHQVEQVTKD